MIFQGHGAGYSFWTISNHNNMLKALYLAVYEALSCSLFYLINYNNPETRAEHIHSSTEMDYAPVISTVLGSADPTVNKRGQNLFLHTASILVERERE